MIDSMYVNNGETTNAKNLSNILFEPSGCKNVLLIFKEYNSILIHVELG